MCVCVCVRGGGGGSGVKLMGGVSRKYPVSIIKILIFSQMRESVKQRSFSYVRNYIVKNSAIFWNNPIYVMNNINFKIVSFPRTWNQKCRNADLSYRFKFGTKFPNTISKKQQLSLRKQTKTHYFAWGRT